MRVNIEVRTENVKHFFSSKVEDIRSNYIILSMPMKAGKIFFLGIDEKIYIYFSKRDSFYCLEVKVEDKQYNPIPTITVIPLKEPYKKQKRSYFRLQITLIIYIKTFDCDNWFEGYICDISAGGARFFLSKDIKKGSFINIKIPAILGESVLNAVVVRTDKNLLRPANVHDIAVEFLEVNEQVRDKIIKFVLAEQRKLRKKGIE